MHPLGAQGQRHIHAIVDEQPETRQLTLKFHCQ
jgi:hypothetical protein